MPPRPQSSSARRRVAETPRLGQPDRGRPPASSSSSEAAGRMTGACARSVRRRPVWRMGPSGWRHARRHRRLRRVPESDHSATRSSHRQARRRSTTNLRPRRSRMLPRSSQNWRRQYHLRALCLPRCSSCAPKRSSPQGMRRRLGPACDRTSGLVRAATAPPTSPPRPTSESTLVWKRTAKMAQSQILISLQSRSKFL